MIKDYELHLPYFKRGDDLSGCREYVAKQDSVDHERADSAKAFLAHAEMMESAANILRKMAGYAKEHGLKITQADTHFISVECTEELGKVLCEEGLLDRGFFDEMEEEEDCAGD